MRRIILGIDTEIPNKVKFVTLEQANEPATSLELTSDHTSLEINDTDLQDGTATDIYVVLVGDVKL